jgi:hypothetical protein
MRLFGTYNFSVAVLNYLPAGTTSVATLPPASGPGAAAGNTSVAAAGTTDVATEDARLSVATGSDFALFEVLPQAHIAKATVAIIKNFFITTNKV